MAMQISSYTFDSMSGEIPIYGESVEDLSRPGLDGHTFRLNGKRGRQFQIQTLSTYSSNGEASNDIENFSSLQGSIVSLTKGDKSLAACLVLDVATSHPYKIGAATNGMLYALNTTWTFQRAG